jgi:drug/metabolite transporter (DMT)-like permease
MSVGFLLGLASAIAWGLASYEGALIARQFGGWIANLGAQLIGFVVTVPVVIVTGWSGASAGNLILLVAVSIGSTIANVATFHLVTLGPVSIIYPILASSNAVVTVLALVLLHQPVDRPQLAGMVMVIGGVGATVYRSAGASEPVRQVLRGRGPGRSQAGLVPDEPSSGVIWVTIAVTLVGGGLLFEITRLIGIIGWPATIAGSRAVQSAALLVPLLGRIMPAEHLRGHSRRWWALLGLVGFLDGLAYILYGASNALGSTAIVSATVSAYAVVPVVLSMALLRERPKQHQTAGIAAVLAGLVLLAL